MTELFQLTETTSSPLIVTDEDKFLDDMRRQERSNRVNNPYAGLKFDGILQETETFGNNNRLYTGDVLREAMVAFNNKIKRGHSLMEDGHPIDPSDMRFQTVLRDNSLAKIRNYVFKGNFLHGQIETLNSIKGTDFKNMLLQGNYQGSSSLRASGAARKTRRGSIVDTKIRIITYDIVLNPSFEASTFKKILTESSVREILKGSENLKSAIESTKMGEKLTESTFSLSNDEKTAIVCNGGQCLKVILETHIANCFKEEMDSL